jgi:chitin disaccharide deacetylase
MKRLIITGDDFGMSAGINRGIVEAHRVGILTSASLMVNRRASREAAALGRDCPGLSLGLHLDLTDLTDAARAPEEVEGQLERFLELVGAAPTHLDSHHDVHLDPRVLPHVLAQAERIAAPVRGHSGIERISKFYGRWGGDAHPEQISPEALLRLVDARVGERVTELVCHPGYVEPGFSSSYGAEREVELRTLCDHGVREALLARGIRLIGFRDLPAPAHRTSTVEDSTCPRS